MGEARERLADVIPSLLPRRGSGSGLLRSLTARSATVNPSMDKPMLQAMATLKTWRLLRKLRCSTTRITTIVKAILALQLAAH